MLAENDGRLDKLLDDVYGNFHVVTSTPTLGDEMRFVVVMGMHWQNFTVYRKTRRIVVWKDPGGWDGERKMLKRHLRLCTKGWNIV